MAELPNPSIQAGRTKARPLIVTLYVRNGSRLCENSIAVSFWG